MKKWSHNKMILPKMREYAKSVDETKYMSFLIKDEQL